MLFLAIPKKTSLIKIESSACIISKDTKLRQNRILNVGFLPDPCISSTSLLLPSLSFPLDTRHLCDWLALCHADLCVRSQSPRPTPPAAGPVSLSAEPLQHLWSPRPPWSPLSSPLTWDTQVFNHLFYKQNSIQTKAPNIKPVSTPHWPQIDASTKVSSR